jgi:hypothetical protein
VCVCVRVRVRVRARACACAHTCMRVFIHVMYQFVQLQESEVYRFMARDYLNLVICSE